MTSGEKSGPFLEISIVSKLKTITQIHLVAVCVECRRQEDLLWLFAMAGLVGLVS
jgi:hypothetical protein